MLRSHFNTFIEMLIISCVNKFDRLIMRVETLRLKIVAFCLVLLLPSNTHVPNQEINTNNTAAIMEHWCHQLASETTVKSVQATVLHHLITLRPIKNRSKLRFSRP